MTELAGFAVGSSAELPLANEGAALATRHFFARAVGELAAHSPSLNTLATILTTTTKGSLDAKSGAYEGTWLALEAAWCGDGPLASATRGAVTDRELRARLYRACVECANHRGDVAAADRAAESFRSELVGTGSLSLLAESLALHNVVHVALQNRLPCAPAVVANLKQQLAPAAKALEQTVRASEAMVGLSAELLGGTPTTQPPCVRIVAAPIG